MAECPHCGAPHSDTAQFCPSCGRSLTETPVRPTKVPARPSPSAPSEAEPIPRVVPAPTRQSPDSTTSWAVVAGAVVIVMVLIGGGLAFALSTKDSSSDAATTPAEPGSGGSSGGGSDPSPSPPTSRFPVTTRARDETSVRSARVLGNFAKLRESPSLGAREITIIQQEGLALEVVGENVDGWYKVRANGFEGWIFGAFVVRPDAGQQVGVPTAGTAVLRDSSGAPTGQQADPPDQVLIVGESDSLWEILNSNGSQAYVAKSEIRVVNS